MEYYMCLFRTNLQKRKYKILLLSVNFRIYVVEMFFLKILNTFAFKLQSKN